MKRDLFGNFGNIKIFGILSDVFFVHQCPNVENRKSKEPSWNFPIFSGFDILITKGQGINIFGRFVGNSQPLGRR